MSQLDDDPTPNDPEPVGAAREASSGESAGDWIGRYELREVIGEGGFGVVWRAEQTEPVRRRVALKIIKLGMDTRQVVLRFEAERQALALMDHPYIARVIDGGATEGGRPYFVMEFVDGAPIVQFADEQQLSVEERLALMTQVCDAIQHAHNKGIVHRDLKPSNVLVGERNGQLQVKVIDFGIAKATAQALTDKTLFTEDGQVIGTLQYMSPEQASGSLDVDTRSDVYSLGILLYELLTGTPPFDLKTLPDALFGEVQRLIREVDPPKPSTRLHESEDTLASIAACRRVEPRRLGTLLRGELDWIVMKALEKDRGRRYATSDGLARDLRRFLNGDAVEAAPPSAMYRVRKLVRRNRFAFTLAAAVSAALLAGVAAFAYQARIARDQRDLALQAKAKESEQRALAVERGTLAEEQRGRAQLAEREASARADELALVADFQASMLARIDAREAGEVLAEDVIARFARALESEGADETERASRALSFNGQWARVNATDVARYWIDEVILSPAIVAIDEQFTEQPLVDARLRQVLADRYRSLGLYEAALPLQVDAFETRRLELGEEHEDTLRSMDRLGLLLKKMGRYTEAEPYVRRALELSSRVLGVDDMATLDRVLNLGVLLEAQGKLAEAEPYLRQTLDSRRRLLGAEDPATLNAINNLAYLFDSQGKAAEAEPLYREALETSRRVLGEESEYTLIAIGNLGALLHRQGRLDEAKPLYLEALETSRRVMGEDHPNTMSVVSNLGVLLRAQGKYAEAAPYYREALEQRRRVLGEEHPETLVSLNNMAALLARSGAFPESEAAYREALEGKRRVLGEGHASTQTTTLALAELLVHVGNFSEAVELMTPVESEARAAFRQNLPQLSRWLRILGRARAGLEDFVAAERALLESHELVVQAGGAPETTVQLLVELYAAWDLSEPNEGHATQSASWKSKR